MKCSKNNTLLQFEFQIQLQSFGWKIENKKQFAKAITRQSKMAPCPRDADIKNDSRRVV
jgi:hypothetical protein